MLILLVSPLCGKYPKFLFFPTPPPKTACLRTRLSGGIMITSLNSIVDYSISSRSRRTSNVTSEGTAVTYIPR